MLVVEVPVAPSSGRRERKRMVGRGGRGGRAPCQGPLARCGWWAFVECKEM